MTRGKVVTWSCDANGNVMSNAHANPILDTRLYQVEFAYGEVPELHCGQLLSNKLPNYLQILAMCN